YGKLTSLGEAREQIESVEGGLDRESVRRTLAQYRKEIKTCYDRALVKKPRISGRVLYQWTITGSGFTSSARQLSSGLETLSLETCVLSIIEGIRWPESKNGSSTIVKYPFEFTNRK
ncbi:MAG: AgmX/PglI C-terminal domain-containing protein, partial [Bdellovibrio sp.]